MNWLRTSSYFAATELLGLLSFVLVAKYVGGLGRFVPVVIALVAVGGIAWMAGKARSYKEIAYVSITVSIVFVAFVQILGRTLFPGLVKDSHFFSASNIAESAVLIAIGFATHVAILSLSRMVRSGGLHSRLQ
jgi:hypothetical protein